MTDRELLKLAAKAAGIEGAWDEEANCFVPHHGHIFWSPLTNDGDALRLAVKLKLPILFVDESVSSGESFIASGVFTYSNDPYAATRRAIVRAAAEIGEGTK